MTDGEDDARAGDLARVAEQLYALPPEEFTAARNARVKETKAAGDKELAQAIAALRKPSSAAWVINQMIRHHGAEIDQLLAVGAALREAQAELEGEQLKALSRQRHQVVAAVARQARALARQLGYPVSATVEAEVEQTLRAALADDDAGRAVTSGQLTKSLDYAALGEASVDLDGAVAVPGAPRPAATAAASSEGAPEGDAAERRQAEVERAELEQAERDAEQAEGDAAAAASQLAEAENHVQALADRRVALEEQIADTERQLAAARNELSTAGREGRTATQERDRAADRAQSAARAADRARARVARLKAW